MDVKNQIKQKQRRKILHKWNRGSPRESVISIVFIPGAVSLHTLLNDTTTRGSFLHACVLCCLQLYKELAILVKTIWKIKSQTQYHSITDKHRERSLQKPQCLHIARRDTGNPEKTCIYSRVLSPDSLINLTHLASSFPMNTLHFDIFVLLIPFII